jgi:hypothetical protein
MAKRSTVQPDWLDDMLVIWGMRDVRLALGYPCISPMFRERTEQPARSYEPTGYTGYQIDKLGECIDKLETRHRLVIMRCFKPWTARAVEAELQTLYDVTDRTWRNWLHEAAALLSADMDRVCGNGRAALISVK